MATTYEQDILAWADEQAAFLRNGQFDRLDLTHLAEEIEDVGKTEKRELRSRVAVLLAHLLKWQYQPERQCRSWALTIRNQRRAIDLALLRTPSLRAACLSDPDWWQATWLDGLTLADKETGLLEAFPEDCPWAPDQIMDGSWLPS